jgi:TDG/mug DNA glycosylase family protein
MNQYERVNHLFEPVYNKESKILILGTFPSVKSRENQFYYGHPRNRFWEIIALVTGEDKPDTIGKKQKLLQKHYIAIWDVIQSCDIVGSSDSSIKNVVPSDINKILKDSQIKRIYGNGGKAYQLYNKYAYHKTNMEMTVLPSTSPANAAYSITKLMEQWKQIREYLN